MTGLAGAAMLFTGVRAGLAPVPVVELATSAQQETPSTAAGPTGTFVGPSVDTEYGAMKVQLAVEDGVIVDVQPLVVGLGDSKSVRINQAAVPELEQRVLRAQSADVDYVSGASYTSEGILASVRGAIDNAGL